MNEVIPIRCSIVRGGTSKAIFIMKNELPADPKLRDDYVLEIFGSPDKRQIDGLGGADVLTSKLAIIGPSTREDADVDYTFGQVSFEHRLIDYKSNCGNISSAVGVYAINNGLVSAVEPVTTVRIHQVNTNRIIVATIKVQNGKAEFDGDTYIDGVPHPGSAIELDFSDSAGSITGKLLPTGNVVDKITTEDNACYAVSIVDAAIPTVFIDANALGLIGTESADEIEQDETLMQKIEEIRGKCAAKIGLLDDYKQSKTQSSYTPFFAIVSQSNEYTTVQGKNISADDIDIVSRLIFMQRMHKAHPVTGTVCMSAAARIPNSIVWNCLAERGKNKKTIAIGHPSGIIHSDSVMEKTSKGYELKLVTITRTARIILDGIVYIAKSRFIDNK